MQIINHTNEYARCADAGTGSYRYEFTIADAGFVALAHFAASCVYWRLYRNDRLIAEAVRTIDAGRLAGFTMWAALHAADDAPPA